MEFDLYEPVSENYEDCEDSYLDSEECEAFHLWMLLAFEG